MATLAQIILYVACACAVNGRYTRGRLHKFQSSPVDHQVAPLQTTRDSDAVIFPTEHDDPKKAGEIIINQANDSSIHKANTSPNVDDIPLISKIVPDVEVKDVFTNNFGENSEFSDKIVIEKNEILDTEAYKGVNIALRSDGIKTAITNDNNGTEIKIDDPKNANKTNPDLSSRFGSTGYGNYLLVPVTNNQNYQPIQTNANVPYYNYNSQGVGAQPTNFVANVGSNIGLSQYTPNVGSNQYTPNGPSQYANGQTTPVLNPSQPSNTYAPINIPNTYVINGQLYAAVTVPNNNNMEVISPMYYVNPQTSAYQVQNSVPLYRLVTVDQGASSQVNHNL